MNAIEATIAGLQGKKVRRVDSESGVFQYFGYEPSTTDRWFDHKGQATYAPYEYGGEWEIYTEPVEIKPGERYVTSDMTQSDLPQIEVVTIGKLENGTAEGCWLCFKIGTPDPPRYTVIAEKCFLRKVET
jgi:hypothetical protein